MNGTQTKIEAKSDSTKTKTSLDSIKLKEVVVTADNIRFEDGKVVMIPTKQAKNHAKNISSFIDIMNTGILQVKDGQITTYSGEPVNLFINGTEVDKMDAATFWAKNVQRVEYIPVPDDMNYLGKNHVLNLVMKEYVTGGLTRLNGDQYFPNNGDYSAASKLVIGKVTLNAMFEGSYDRNRLNGDKRTEDYENVWYDGVEYNNISRTEESSSIQRKNSMFAGLNARYKGKK